MSSPMPPRRGALETRDEAERHERERRFGTAAGTMPSELAPLEIRLRQHAALADLGRFALSESADLDAVLDEAMTLVSQTLRLSGAGVAELLPDGDSFLVRRETLGGLAGGIMPLANSMPGAVLDGGASVVIPDAAEDRARISPELVASGIRSAAGVRIGSAEAPFGVLCVFSRSRAAFEPEDVLFLESAAYVIAEAARREAAELELLRHATHDIVTGLPNRTLLQDRLEQALARTWRNNTCLGVLHVDLDRFRRVNDSLGPRGADDVLRETAARLRSAVRATDTVARLSGDEFAVVADDLEGEQDASGMAGSILASLQEPIAVAGRRLHLQASVGVAVTRAPADTELGRLLRDAEHACHEAKVRGRGRWVMHDRVGESGHDALQVEQELRHALVAGELRLACQPIVRLDDGAPIGAEALLRWQHPVHGLVGPAAFLDVAEQTGLIVPIGEWMLREACAHARRWATDRDFLLTVNLSATQLADPGIVAAVRSALAGSGLEPRVLGLELTEQVLVGSGDEVFVTLSALKAMGVRVLLDDFGTGYSSLSHLKRFPIDVVKVDRSFVAGLGRDHRSGDAAIVSAIVEMSWATGKQVIPEGVETQEQVDVLRRMGCGLGQGFHFSRPLAPDRFEAWMAETIAAGPDPAPPAPSEVSLTLDRSTGLGDTSRQVLARLEAQMPASTALWIGHLDREMKVLRVVAEAGGASFGLRAGMETPIDQSLCQMLASGRGPEVTGDAGASPYASLRTQQALQVGSFAGQPIVADGRIVGTLCAISTASDAFDANHLDWLAMAALVMTGSLQATGGRGPEVQRQMRRAAHQNAQRVSRRPAEGI